MNLWRLDGKGGMPADKTTCTTSPTGLTWVTIRRCHGELHDLYERDGLHPQVGEVRGRVY